MMLGSNEWYVPFSLFLAFFAIAACGDDSDLPSEVQKEVWVDPLGELPNLGRVSFQQPQVGQRSSYLEFEENYNRPTGTASTTYTGDTLIMGILGIRGDTLEIVEYYSQFSPIEDFGSDASGERILYLSTELLLGDSLYIRPLQGYSHIFLLNPFLPLTDRLDTLAQHISTIPVYDLNAQAWMARVDEYAVGEVRLDSLIVYFDYTNMATDGLGLCSLYSIDLGVIRSAYINPWDSNKSNGWDLLLE
ncbi:MAG: hypothetical protein RIF33_00995 [Cyclobacteriaceae bacterium]